MADAAAADVAIADVPFYLVNPPTAPEPLEDRAQSSDSAGTGSQSKSSVTTLPQVSPQVEHVTIGRVVNGQRVVSDIVESQDFAGIGTIQYVQPLDQTMS